MKSIKLYFITVILFLTACKFSDKINKENNLKNDSVLKRKLVVTNIDSISLPLYNMVKFYFVKNKKNGIILDKKSNINKYFVGQEINAKLCDVFKYSDIYIENNIDSVKNLHFVFENQEKTKKTIDTINYRGDVMKNLKIFNNNKLVIDFGDNAVELVYEICD